MEFFLLANDFTHCNDNDLYKKTLNDAYIILNKTRSNYPEYASKIKQVRVAGEEELQKRTRSDDIKKTTTIYVEYKQNGLHRSVFTDIIGKDTNLGTGTFTTIELVTPPCESIKELSWWVGILIKSMLEACKKNKLYFLPIASHPDLDNYFCGEHHHIGIRDPGERLKIYNVMRFFLPILSILSYSSFQKDEAITKQADQDIFKARPSNQNTRSKRLSRTQQIKAVPELSRMNRTEFASALKLSVETCRMVDMYPFTRYETLEVRIFDAQLSIARTIATAILLQAICSFALTIEDECIKKLTSLYTMKPYSMVRDDAINEGLLANTKTKPSFQTTFNKEFTALCRDCNNTSRCNKKELGTNKCQFSVDDEIFHNLASFLFLPHQFRNNQQIFGKNVTNIKNVHQIKQMMSILKPHIQAMQLANSIPLRIVLETIKKEMEASMFLLVIYRNYGKKRFYEELVKIQEKIISGNTVWGIYYDPFFESRYIV